MRQEGNNSLLSPLAPSLVPDEVLRRAGDTELLHLGLEGGAFHAELGRRAGLHRKILRTCRRNPSGSRRLCWRSVLSRMNAEVVRYRNLPSALKSSPKTPDTTISLKDWSIRIARGVGVSWLGTLPL